MLLQCLFTRSVIVKRDSYKNKAERFTEKSCVSLSYTAEPAATNNNWLLLIPINL